jgi:fucose 4-O-acetylase-like acetyltransferase
MIFKQQQSGWKISMSQFKPEISYIRVFSMLTVILTHYLSWVNVYTFQINTIAVSSFLFISGYLYGNKSIDNRKEWIKKKINRVLIPFWILAVALSIYLIAKGDYQFALRQIVESFLNLQGIHNIIFTPFALGYGHLPGLAHCWFLTIIMLCYIGIVFLKNSRVENFGDNHPGLLLLFSIVLHIAFCFINVAIGCFIIFFIGYFYRRLESTRKTSNSFFALITFAMFVAVSIRIVLKKYIDGECFYDFFIASISSNICAIWCFILVKWICEKRSLFVSIPIKKSWKWLDNMTYPLYLTHYMFLKEPFVLPQGNIYLSTILFVVLSIISAMLLNAVTKNFERK